MMRRALGTLARMALVFAAFVAVSALTYN